jgi:alkaline phosphatase
MTRHTSKLQLTLLTLTGIFAALLIAIAISYPYFSAEINHKPRNIILMIGDGMGPAHLKAYRKFRDDPATQVEEKTLFDQYLVGSVSTESYDDQENITDSAAAATAYATGHRILNDALAIDADGNPIETLFEQAKKQGLSTGMVVTSQVVHATPAAFVSHHTERKDYNIIADQYIDNQINGQPVFDVLLGGGTKYFSRKDRDLVKEFEQKGFEFLTNKQQLLATQNDKLLGLFANKSLDKMWDRKPETPSLADMSRVAIDKLSQNPQGFVLMIEASKIDWAAHEKDILGVLSEMQDFEAALKQVVEFAQKDGETLVVLTADHETGGLSVGSGDSGEYFYYWDLDVIKSFKYTTAKMATDAQQSGDLLAEFNKASTLSLSDQEKHILQQADLSNWYLTRRAATQVINKRSFTGWTSFAHTGVDVNLYAMGVGHEQLYGHWDNDQLGRYLLSLLEE